MNVCSKESPPVLCEHLQAIEQAILQQGVCELSRGQAWSLVREWVYFDCYIDVDAVRRNWPLDACVVNHVHRGTHDGQEQGLACSQCGDGIMGTIEPRAGKPIFTG